MTITAPSRQVRRRRLTHSVVALAAAGLLGLPGAAPAAADEGRERELLALLNGERAARGLAPLRLEATLDRGAGRHASRMGAEGRVFHSTLGASAPAGWSRLGENVGRAGSVRPLHDALMGSPPHRANVLDPSFDYVGIGVAGSGSSLFAAFAFADHPSPAIGLAAAADQGRSASSDGRVATWGGATFHGDLAGVRLAGPVVAMEPAPGGRGYWLVAADGGVFAFGDARFHGSMGGQRLSAPIVDLVATPSGRGYWLAGADGGVFAFGDAPFLGSTGGRALSAPITSMNRTHDGRGYALYAADGGRHGFGRAHR